MLSLFNISLVKKYKALKKVLHKREKITTKKLFLLAIGCEGDTLQRAKKQGNLRFDAAFFAFRLILSVEACKSLLGNLLIKDRPLSSKNLSVTILIL